MKTKKPDSAFMKKFRTIQKTRTYRTIENVILFFIIFMCVKYYSIIYGFIYSKTLSISRGALNLFKDNNNDNANIYEKYYNQI